MEVGGLGPLSSFNWGVGGHEGAQSIVIIPYDSVSYL